MKFRKGDSVLLTRKFLHLEPGTLCTVTKIIDEAMVEVEIFSVVNNYNNWNKTEVPRAYLDLIVKAEEEDITVLKIKKIADNAIIPEYAKPGDAAMDLTATSKEWDQEKQCVVFGTGIAMEIPPGYVGLIFPRSSICKVPLLLSNSVGVIDSGYRGEIKFFFRPTDRPQKNYEIGDRIGQIIIMPFPQVRVEVVEELSESERGDGGFGSSGK